MKSKPADGNPPFDLEQAFRAVASVHVLNQAGDEIVDGSGFFVEAEGALVTNYHVVEQAASAFVKTHEGGYYSVRGILSEDSKHDLVLLKVEGHRFAILRIENTEQVHPGEKVFAIGTPLGLESTLSDGIVSGVREAEGNRVIQTTAPISPGSSGGPLLNTEGKVVGVTTFQIVGGQNLNFAVPSAYIPPLLEARVVHPFSPPTSNETHPEKSPLTENKAAHEVRVFPKNWIRVQDGTRVDARVEGDLVYAEGEFPGDGGYISSGTFTCEAEKSPDKWTGKCRYTLQMTWGFLSNRPTCYVTTSVAITSLSPQRIEGVLQQLSAGRTVGECPVPGRADRFTLIPSEPVD